MMEILEFWGGILTDQSKLVLTRDELTSIFLFMIVKAEIPDLYTQFKIMAEFTSSDIQESAKGYPISETFMLV